MSGRITAEYEDYSLYETVVPEIVTLRPRPPLPSGVPVEYRVATTQTILVSSYQDALLEPEWDVFQ